MKAQLNHIPWITLDHLAFNKYKTALHWHPRKHPAINAIREHESCNFKIMNDMGNNVSSDLIYFIPGLEDRASRGDKIEHSIVLFPKSTNLSYGEHDANDSIQIRTHPNDPGRPQYTVDEIAQHFRDYPSFVGLDIFCRSFRAHPADPKKDIHPHRRGKGSYVRNSMIWDKLLTDYGFRIWGFGVTDGYDDMEAKFGHSTWESSWIDLLLAEVNEASIRQALKNGHFYFVNYLDNTKEIPKVNKVTITNESIDLVVTGDYEQIYWIYNHEVVGTGNSFELSQWKTEQKYIRFEIWSKKSDYWESGKRIGTPAFEESTAFYRANITGSQPIFATDLPRRLLI